MPKTRPPAQAVTNSLRVKPMFALSLSPGSRVYACQRLKIPEVDWQAARTTAREAVS